MFPQRQVSLNLAISHVDSARLKRFGGRISLDVAEFMYHNLYEKLDAFSIHKIGKDKVILKPYLFKK